VRACEIRLISLHMGGCVAKGQVDKGTVGVGSGSSVSQPPSAIAMEAKAASQGSGNAGDSGNQPGRWAFIDLAHR
jgi:hypothetical protein